MNFPCPNSSGPCENPAGDNAVINESAEKPDSLKFFSVWYPPFGTPGFDPFPGPVPVANFCEADTEEAAMLCATQPNFPAPGSPTLFASTAQTCSVTCSDGSVVSFVSPAQLFYASTQAAADAQAAQFACLAANSFCSTTRPRSVEQTCDFLCDDDTISSYTVAAGAFMGDTQADADAASYAFACLVASLLCGGGSPPSLFSSSPQSCTVTCPGGEAATVTVPAASALGLSQAEADSNALDLACALATLSCSNIPTLVTNTAQTCTQSCNGIPVSYTVPAGVLFGLDQASANFTAFAYACAAVALTCVTGDPVPPTTVGNTPQTCPIACEGGTFVFTLGAGEVRAENLAAANAQAASIACLIGQAQKVCLSAIQTSVCVNTPYASAIGASGSIGPIVKTSGTLPPGVTLSGGVLFGTPTTTGSYTFTVQANSAGGYTTRTYTISVVGIIGGLAGGTVDEAYSSAISTSGMTSPTFSVTGGVLPDGLSLNGTTGVISGTPTDDGTSVFVVQATDGANSCSASLSITIASTAPTSPTEWWKLDEAGGTRTGAIAGVALDELADPVGSAAGLIDVAASLGAGTEFLFTPAPTPVLGYQGNGFDACGWIKPVAYSTSPFDEFNLVGWNDDAVGNYKFQVCCEPWTGGHPAVVGPPCFRINFKGDGLSENVYINYAFPLGVWVFWRVFYDTALGKFGAQINNGAIVYTSVKAFSAFANSNFGIVSTPFGASTWLYDETGIWVNKMLTAAEVTYLYNAGAGRTFPLPP